VDFHRSHILFHLVSLVHRTKHISRPFCALPSVGFVRPRHLELAVSAFYPTLALARYSFGLGPSVQELRETLKKEQR
jgi:hypothetical protein